MKSFEGVNQHFGFGCMRLPMNGTEVDVEQVKEMVDAFIADGFNYFDTAHGYIDGKSELAIKEALTSRYARNEYILTDKLTGNYFNKQEDIRPFFESQLQACGVDYFDFYLMHAQGLGVYPKFQECHAYETAYAFKKEGLIKHFGISFHDKPEVLDQILTDHPEVEVVQIQFNYLDYDDLAVQSKAVYEVCVKHQKPVIVMEPVKGGSLVKLPEDAQAVLDGLHGGSNASYALRFAASFDQMFMILSGMSDLAQMNDNLSFMKDVQPLNEEERNAVKQVTEIFNSKHAIPCTSCKYCIEENHCPKQIRIPDLFASLNAKKLFGDWNADFYYSIATKEHGKASDCVQCGMCEKVCPQHLPIRDLLKQVKETFEK